MHSTRGRRPLPPCKQSVWSSFDIIFLYLFSVFRALKETFVGIWRLFWACFMKIFFIFNMAYSALSMPPCSSTIVYSPPTQRPPPPCGSAPPPACCCPAPPLPRPSSCRPPAEVGSGSRKGAAGYYSVRSREGWSQLHPRKFELKA